MMTPITSFRGPYVFLSNFSPHPVTMPGGRTYQTAEHAFQAAKAITQQDHDFIAGQETPGRAKRAGRSVQCRADWETVKNEVMLAIIRAKFSRHFPEGPADLLEATGDADLIEGNTWGDQYWGVCNGVGQNWLGKILMAVRADNRN